MCSPKVKQPDTSLQQAEAQRQREAEDQRQRELIEAQRLENERQRAENERIARENREADDRRAREARDLQISQEAERTRRENEIEATRQREREADLARQNAETERTNTAARNRADATREYASGRERFTNQAYEFIDRAYAGFDDDYFNGFARDFVNYYKPQVERQFGDANRSLTYMLADSGNLNSSAAANEFSDLVRQRGEMEAGIAGRALTARDQLRQSIDQQKSDARGAVLSASGVGADIQLDDLSQVGDALSNYGRTLQSPVLNARSRAGSFTPGGYSSLSSLVGDLTVPTIRGNTRTIRTTQPSGLYGGASGLDASSLRVVA